MVVSGQRAAAAHANDGAISVTERILDRVFPGPRAFAIRLWNGTTLPAPEPVPFTLVLTHPGALRRMLLPPTDLAMGEAFVRGDFDVDGDLGGAVAAVVDAALRRTPAGRLAAGLAALRLPRTSAPGSVPPRAR